MTEVLLHGVPAEVQALADLRIRQTLGNEPNDAQLLATQLRFLRSTRIDQQGRSAWIDHAFACKHALDRSPQIEVLVIRDKEAARAGVERRFDSSLVALGREGDDRSSGLSFQNLSADLGPGAIRELEVEQHDVGPMLNGRG